MKNDNICTYFVLSFILSFLGCYHLCYHLMLSFFAVSNCYHFYVIILCYHLSYHLMLLFFTVSKCYHFFVIIFPCTYFVLSFMLSYAVIIYCYHFLPFSLFPENVTHSFLRQTWCLDLWGRPRTIRPRILWPPHLLLCPWKWGISHYSLFHSDADYSIY